MRLIDSHCHLNYEGLAERQEEVLEAARQRGVQGFLNISTASANGMTSSELPSVMRTSGPRSAFIRTKPMPIPTLARRRSPRLHHIPV